MNWLDKFIVSERGQWDYPGYPTAVPTKNGRITMEGVPYPVIGFVPGQPPVMMQPGKNYKFPVKDFSVWKTSESASFTFFVSSAKLLSDSSFADASAFIFSMSSSDNPTRSS